MSMRQGDYLLYSESDGSGNWQQKLLNLNTAVTDTVWKPSLP
ncbi:MAG: hypothetical protein R2865_14240 [Deinococcales bacterium]